MDFHINYENGYDERQMGMMGMGMGMMGAQQPLIPPGEFDGNVYLFP